MRYFSVFDKAVAAFLPMFPAKSRAHAIRMVEDAALDPKGEFIKHLLDYELYDMGDFDESTGKFAQSADAPARVLSLIEFKKEGE